jgi:hypothetical protein
MRSCISRCPALSNDMRALAVSRITEDAPRAVELQS